MTLRSLMPNLRHFLDVRPGEATRIGFMAAFLFFLLAANNVIKIVRDALFLSRFPITELPYVYLMAAAIAGAVITIYSRYTSRFSLLQVVLGSHVFIISNVIIFWLLIVYYDFGWVLYAFYIWSAIVGLVAVAQFWTLANDMFTPREGKRLFGIIAAGGTLGGMMGGMVSNWAVRFLFDTNQLLWFIVALFAGAFGVAYLALGERERLVAANYQPDWTRKKDEHRDVTGGIAILLSSRYLQTIAAVIFVSVVVSTLIDYQFKATAKSVYPSANALAGFFGSYYAWLSVVTMLAQLWLTGKLLTRLGLTPSLLVLPSALLVGSLSLLAWPGLLAATATRMTEASLRTSVNQSSVQILYLPVADAVKKRVKVFLDVTVERLGDGTAAFIILFYTLVLGGAEVTLLSYFSIGLIFIWAAVVFVVQGGYMEALRRSLAYREMSLKEVQIDYAEKGTVDAVLKILEEKDEPTVIFGLDLIEKLDPNDIVARLPRGLLHHSSSAIRARAIKLFATRPDATTLNEVSQMLQDPNHEVQAQAISAASAIFETKAIPIVRPYLESSDPKVRGQVLECLLRYGDAASRASALSHFGRMINDATPEGEQSRIEATRLIGAVYDPAFSSYLARLIREDRSSQVIREAMAAAANGKYPEVIKDIICRLSGTLTMNQARDTLVQVGEVAVEPLRETLSDAKVSRDVRINIPRTLSKIPSQSAMDVLLSALHLEDRSIRYKVILGLEEMARRFPALRVNREMIERAIISDAMLYFRRFVIFCVLFGVQNESGRDERSLLRDTLGDSMERVQERVMWLLSLIYPPKDIRSVWFTLTSRVSTQRAYAIELLDNLLAGQIKQHVFPLFSDAPQAQRCKTALGFLGMDAIDTGRALRLLLQQDDIWLTAATIWEIGIRKLSDFREEISTLANCENQMLRETVAIVMDRIPAP